MTDKKQELDMTEKNKQALVQQFNRRGFIKGCAIAATALGLPESMIPKLVEAATDAERPRIIWLKFQCCTGCTESLFRSSNPDISQLLFDIISMEYHETLMVAAGHQAEQNLFATVSREPFLLVVEGAIPTQDGGIHCKIAGRTAMDMLEYVAPYASAIIAIGTCASFGGIQAAAPNPTAAVGVQELVTDVPIVNIPGCPPNPVSFLGTILHYLTFMRFPAMDSLKRPLFAYGSKIHDLCERRSHYDESRFVGQFGDQFHNHGYCLYKVGCKGLNTYSNCPTVRFNDAIAWPVSVGHGCIGCTQPNFWDTMTPFYENMSIPPQKRIGLKDAIKDLNLLAKGSQETCLAEVVKILQVLTGR
jgi:hydrogenase small subunit/[NiFe] hydrogenase small subunit